MLIIPLIYNIKKALINIKTQRVRLLTHFKGPNFVRWSVAKNPQPCFKEQIISIFVWKLSIILSFFPQQNHFLEASKIMITSAIPAQLHPSKIIEINTFAVDLALLIFYMRLQMIVNVRGLMMSINGKRLSDIKGMPKLHILDYNLNMISKKKEIQENLESFNAKQVIHLSTAQEKESLSNARPFQHTYPQIVEENWEAELISPQNSFCHFLEESGSESNTSIEKRLTFEHLACLEANIQEISKHVLKVPKNMDLTKLCDYEYYEDQQTFGRFIQGQRSPIPPSQRPQFLGLLKQNSCLRKVIMWIYGHVQSQLSDELILTAHRIALAYHPIKAFVAGASEWQKLAQLEFNIWNAYNDPTLKLLHYSQLLRLQQGGLYYDAHLHRFFRFYLVTILLVLQEYFENPDYGNILGSKLQTINKGSMARHKKASKFKIIRKKQKPRP